MTYPFLTSDYPITDLISVADMRQSLRVSSTWDEADITSRFDAARQVCEEYAGRSFKNQTWTYYLDDWPKGEIIYLPKGKCQSVTSLEYRDGSGAFVTLASGTDYNLEKGGHEGRLTPVSGWPSLDSARVENVKIVFVAGYGTDVPSALINGVKALAQSDFWGNDDKAWKRYLMLFRWNFNYSRNDP